MYENIKIKNGLVISSFEFSFSKQKLSVQNLLEGSN